MPTTVKNSSIKAGRLAVPLCRACGVPLTYTFVDLGMSPLCQTQIRPEELNSSESFFPLRVHLCQACFLVQLEEYVSPQTIFSGGYPYFSSYSVSWVEHARRYVEDMVALQGIGSRSFVVEIASNDGYLLQHLVAKGIRCLGVEPTANTADAARKKGDPNHR